MCAYVHARQNEPSTWHGGGFCGCSEGQDAGLGFALLVDRHNADLVFRVPVQSAQHHVLTAVRHADLRFPVGHVLLRKKQVAKYCQG